MTVLSRLSMGGRQRCQTTSCHPPLPPGNNRRLRGSSRKLSLLSLCSLSLSLLTSTSMDYALTFAVLLYFNVFYFMVYCSLELLLIFMKASGAAVRRDTHTCI